MGNENRGELRRIGFEATAKINRHDFGVAWQDEIPGGGVVVSNEIQLVLDVEAILLDDLEQTGAIEYYRNQAPVNVSSATTTGKAEASIPEELNPRRLWRRLVPIGAGVVAWRW